MKLLFLVRNCQPKLKTQQQQNDLSFIFPDETNYAAFGAFSAVGVQCFDCHHVMKKKDIWNKKMFNWGLRYIFRQASVNEGNIN